MGADDDADCVEHVWQLVGATIGGERHVGVVTEYVCTRCAAVLAVPPGGVHPATV
jgi:hypothetical protein